ARLHDVRRAPADRDSRRPLRTRPRGASPARRRREAARPVPWNGMSIDAILAALETVIDPELQRPVTELDMVRDVSVEDGIVSLTIVLTVVGCPLRDSFERQVEQALADVPGVRGFSLSFGVMTPEERQALTTKLRGGVERDTTIRLPSD